MYAELCLKLTTICALTICQDHLHWLTLVRVNKCILCEHAIHMYGLPPKYFWIGPSGPYHTIFLIKRKEMINIYIKFLKFWGKTGKRDKFVFLMKGHTDVDVVIMNLILVLPVQVRWWAYLMDLWDSWHPYHLEHITINMGASLPDL